MHIRPVFGDVLPLTTDTPRLKFVRSRAAHDADIAVARPHLVELFAHRIVRARLPVVLFEVDDAFVAPRDARLTAPADDLERVIVRVSFDHHPAGAPIARPGLFLFKLLNRHQTRRSTIRNRRRNRMIRAPRTTGRDVDARSHPGVVIPQDVHR